MHQWVRQVSPHCSYAAPCVPGAPALSPSGDGRPLLRAQRPATAGGAAGGRGARGLPGGRPEGPGRGGGAGGQPGQCGARIRSEAAVWGGAGVQGVEFVRAKIVV